MIGVFSDDTTRLAIAYNGLTLNSPTDPSDDTYEVNAAVVAPQLDTIEDPNADDDGLEAYKVRKVRAIITIDGTMRAPTIARLFDKSKAFVAAFDPAKASHENPATAGFLPLTFSTPTLDTTNYATGLVPSRYFARARRLFVPAVSEYTGYSAFFRCELEAADPRRYLQTIDSKSGAGDAGNTLADYRSFPVLTLTASGAGSATYTISRAVSGFTTKQLVLNLSTLVNADVVLVDMAAHSITKNGVYAPSLYVSGNWFEIEPGTNTLTITNGTNITTVTAWNRAFCA